MTDDDIKTYLMTFYDFTEQEADGIIQVSKDKEQIDILREILEIKKAAIAFRKNNSHLFLIDNERELK